MLDFPSINRSLFVIRLKQPYVDWANALPDRSGTELESPHILEDLNEDAPAYLVPEIADYSEIDLSLDKMWIVLFEEMLSGWTTDEGLWPKKRTRKMFKEWFEITVHSLIKDLWGKEPLEYND
jgi:hypothetical protein